jgi:hypothetical protein
LTESITDRRVGKPYLLEALSDAVG